MLSLTKILIAIASITGDPTPAWPAFLGQGASPVDPATIPLTWAPDQNIAWKSAIPGKGQSSPVIWGDTVFVTSIEGSMKDTCYLLAYDLASGRPLWKVSTPSAQPVRSNYFQSRSAPTPVVDAHRVYAFFETGNLLAADHKGQVVWERSLTEDYGPFESSIGLASSPVVFGNHVIILADHEGPSYLLAVDTATGETVWQTERDSRKSYASPAIVPVAGKPHIVCSSDGSVDGYDPATGKLLWSYADVGGNTSYTPLPIADGQFFVAASPGMHNEREEKARKSNFFMRIEAVGDSYKPVVVWSTKEAMPTFASPMAHQGQAYWVNRVGVIYCFDLKTGENVYTERTKQTAWATPVGLGDRLYVFGKDGVTTVLAAGPEFKVLAENALWDPKSAGEDPLNRERAARERSHGGEHNQGGDRPSADKASGALAAEPAKGGPPVAAAQAATAPATPPAGRPPMTDKEREEARARGEGQFPDPVQFGVALVNGSLVIRTGDTLYCVRHSKD